MTNKEAVEALERLFSDSTDESYPFCEEFGEAVGVAVEALYTKIPARVQIEDWSSAYCPNCGEELSYSEGDGHYRHLTALDVCPNPECCQRLDWGYIKETNVSERSKK